MMLAWVEQTLHENVHRMVPVTTLALRRLANHFPADALGRAKVVVVEAIPVPPIAEAGLDEVNFPNESLLGGITLVDTYFIRESNARESLHFHEMVHVLQWERLGIANFLRAYGIGLIEFGYIDNPLEGIAYSLQEQFDGDLLTDSVAHIVNAQTDEYWRQVQLAYNLAGVEMLL
jgi:hypothetical protein